MAETKRVTASVLLIGDEVLSGRTQDKNLQQIARFLAPLGINVVECRVVPDIEDEIVEAVNTLRAKTDYVFTTGGIGPTHDDITADSIAKAFGMSIDVRDDALAIIEHWYAKTQTPVTESRKRMARIPEGSSLIENPVSGAPGFQTENVFTMAGVPAICRGMLEDIAHRLEKGVVTLSRSVKGDNLREGEIAEALGTLQDENPNVSLGSYPYFMEVKDGKIKRGTHLVARSTDSAALDGVIDALTNMVSDLGYVPRVDPED